MKKNLEITGPTKIGVKNFALQKFWPEKGGAVIDQQRGYFRQLFEVSYSIPKRGHPHVEFVDIIKLEKL